MSLQPLDNLAKVGRLKTEPPSEGEVAGLIGSGLARLNDARNPSLSIESRFDLAYNAAHALSLAALRRAGYRSDNRYIVFQCLPHTVGLENHQWRVLDQAHRRRNLAEYEGRLEADVALIDAMVRTAEAVARRLEA